MFKKICSLIFVGIICLSVTFINNRPIFLDKSDSLEVYLSNSSSGEIIRLYDKKCGAICVKGESYRVDKGKFSLESFIDEFNGEIIFQEKIDEGISYYGYSSEIKYRKIMNGRAVNFHVFIGENSVTVGAPIIYGSF